MLIEKWYYYKNYAGNSPPGGEHLTVYENNDLGRVSGDKNHLNRSLVTTFLASRKSKVLLLGIVGQRHEALDLKVTSNTLKGTRNVFLYYQFKKFHEKWAISDISLLSKVFIIVIDIVFAWKNCIHKNNLLT